MLQSVFPGEMLVLFATLLVLGMLAKRNTGKQTTHRSSGASGGRGGLVNLGKTFFLFFVF